MNLIINLYDIYRLDFNFVIYFNYIKHNLIDYGNSHSGIDYIFNIYNLVFYHCFN